MERNIVEIYSGVGSGNWWLNQSQEFLPGDEMSYLDAFCALKLERKGIILVCRIYASKNSPIDLLTGFPAETLHKDGSEWQDKGESNGFPLKAKSTRHVQGEVVVVTTEYDFPDNYSGPSYKTRKIWFDTKTMQIQKVEMLFKNGQKDIGEFTYEDDQLKIDWTLNSGFLNQMNVNFF